MGCPSLTNLSKGNIVEQLSYYCISALVLLLRGCIRLRTRGWRKLQVDDYIAVWVFFCVCCAGFFTNASLWLGGTWLFLGTPQDVDLLLPCQVEDVRMGSIYNVLNWLSLTSRSSYYHVLLLTYYYAGTCTLGSYGASRR